MKLSSLIKKQDLFGHRILLNFNKKGSSYQSILGGSFSILIKLIILIYFGFLTNSLIAHENDNTQSITVPLDTEALGNVNFNETYVNPMLIVFNWKLKRYLSKEEYSKYIKIIFTEYF